jgi:hypothetical protein
VSYLKKPSTYVIGALAIGVYLWLLPMATGFLRARTSSGASS